MQTTPPSQEDPSKPGPKPKQLKQGEIWGLEVGRGENRHIVPPDQVYELASIGCTDREIAYFFNVNEETLRYNFKEQLEKGREYIKTKLRRNLMRAADNLQPAILIFLSKNILGMSDQPLANERSLVLPWSDDLDNNASEDSQNSSETLENTED